MNERARWRQEQRRLHIIETGEALAEDAITCPYCGYAGKASWEWEYGAEADGESECGECGRTFECSRHVSVRYSTRCAQLGPTRKHLRRFVPDSLPGWVICSDGYTRREEDALRIGFSPYPPDQS